MSGARTRRAYEVFIDNDRRRHLRRLAKRLTQQTYMHWTVRGLRNGEVELRRDEQVLYAGDTEGAEEIILASMLCDYISERYRRVDSLAKRLSQASRGKWRVQILSEGRWQLVSDGEPKYAGSTWAIENHLLGGLSMVHELKSAAPRPTGTRPRQAKATSRKRRTPVMGQRGEASQGGPR